MHSVLLIFYFKIFKEESVMSKTQAEQTTADQPLPMKV